MGNIELSNRLKQASAFVVKNKTAIDIGSDHAYLPIYLVQNDFVDHAIAGEVVKGPFLNAKNKVEEFNLSNRINVRMGNGLEVINERDEIGTVFICGMGGALISDIIKKGLEQGNLPTEARLVLQPNNAEESVRTILKNNNYKIIDEAILQENAKIYEIIVAEFHGSEMPYTMDELYFGPVLLKEKSKTFMTKWQKEIDKINQILLQLEHSNNLEKKEAFTQKMNRIEKVIK